MAAKCRLKECDGQKIGGQCCASCFWSLSFPSEVGFEGAGYGWINRKMVLPFHYIGQRSFFASSCCDSKCALFPWRLNWCDAEKRRERANRRRGATIPKIGKLLAIMYRGRYHPELASLPIYNFPSLSKVIFPQRKFPLLLPLIQVLVSEQILTIHHSQVHTHPN